MYYMYLYSVVVIFVIIIYFLFLFWVFVEIVGGVSPVLWPFAFIGWSDITLSVLFHFHLYLCFVLFGCICIFCICILVFVKIAKRNQGGARVCEPSLG